MRWKKVKYPYIYYEDRKDLMEQSMRNFNNFVQFTGVDKFDLFNYGYNISAVFRGENPRYNPYSLDHCNVIDHLHYLFRNSNTGATYGIAVPYAEDNGSNSRRVIMKICNKHNVSCIVLPPKESIYNAHNTNFLIFSQKCNLLELLKKYGYSKDDVKFFEPDISFYSYVMKYINVDLPEGDLAKDMRDDKDMPKDIDNDMEVFSYLDFTINDFRAEKVYKKLKKEYLESKFKIS